jgi:hypothetical protein
MKSNMLSITAHGKKMVIMLLVVISTLTSAIANTPDSTIDDQNASVSCLKMEEGQVYFKVKYDNADGGRFDIVVNDGAGENLYRATFTGKNFDRVFKAPVDNGRLVIMIRDNNNKTTQTFELTTEARMVQQIYVKRM